MPLSTPREGRDERIAGGKRGRDSDQGYHGNRDSYGRDSYGRDSYGRDSYSRDNRYGRDSREVFVAGRDSHGGKKKPCFAFQKGECTLGNKCRYSHDIVDKNDTETTKASVLDRLNSALPGSGSKSKSENSKDVDKNDENR